MRFFYLLFIFIFKFSNASYLDLLLNLYANNSQWTEASLNNLLKHIESNKGLIVNCSKFKNSELINTCEAAQKCDSISHVHGDKEIDFHRLCPQLVYHSQLSTCKSAPSTEHTSNAVESSHLSASLSSLEVWCYSLFFVTLISCSSVLAVILLPVIGKQYFYRLMPGFIGLAVGSLSSGAMFHLIPQAFGLLELGNHDYLNISLAVLLSVWFFNLIERCLRIYTNYRIRLNTQSCDKSILPFNSSKNHLVPVSYTNTVTLSTDSSLSPVTTEHKPSTCGSDQQSVVAKSAEHQTGHFHLKSHLVDCVTNSSEAKSDTISTVAMMIMLGDSMHNFFDGISIGAAFSHSLMTGLSISLAVICEEVPHELGDFAVLIDAGMSIKRAMAVNFASACVCFLGMVVGIFMGDVSESASYAFAITGGIFLYIAFVDMLPELSEAVTQASEVSVRDSVKLLLLQNVGILSGIFFLFILAVNADAITFA